MLTVLESINLSAEYLTKKGIESPRINAELLLSDILKCKRLDLYLMFDRPLQEEEIIFYRELLKRRASNEPLQYILGKVEFYGLEFKVNRSVLIPRPETELLVEEIIKNTDKNSPLKILDIGSGSGNISVALSKHLPLAQVTGIDISYEALKTAAENAYFNGVSEKTIFYNKNIFSANGLADKEFDIIVSNPPYISSKEYETLEPELKYFEPRHALTDENDGLNFYRKILSISHTLLKKHGVVYFELGKDQFEDVKKIYEESKFSEIKIIKDYQNIERIISGVID